MCREYQRGACKRAESECRFAHPADSVTANEDGTVTVCMDAVKGRCNRDPCRYFHPPLHLQAQIKAAQSRASAVCYAVLVRTPATLSLCSSFLRADGQRTRYTHCVVPFEYPFKLAPSTASAAPAKVFFSARNFQLSSLVK